MVQFTVRKIKNLKPEYRAEYPYLIPLAEANGVFECRPPSDLGRPHTPLPSFDGTSPGWVLDLISDLKRVDLLRTWEEKGKTWGWWVGIDKTGRLPSKEHPKEIQESYRPFHLSEFVRMILIPELSGITPGLALLSPWFGMDWIGMVWNLRRWKKFLETFNRRRT